MGVRGGVGGEGTGRVRVRGRGGGSGEGEAGGCEGVGELRGEGRKR